MRAVVYREYGGPEGLRLQEVEIPRPEPDEVRIQVRAAAINPYDWHFMRGEPRFMRLTAGLRRPKRTILGSDAAGIVDAVGENVTRWRPGDEVMSEVDSGGLAEYVTVAEDRVGPRPSNATFEEAAGLPMAGLTALQGLRDFGAGHGTRALVVGASGGVGTLAVQIGKALGAEVTGVCSTRNVELVRSLGADHVVDYTRQDFTRGTERYDLILQLAGTQSVSACRRALARKGVLVLSSGEGGGKLLGPMPRLVRGMLLSPFVSQRIVALIVKSTTENLQELSGLVESGDLVPVVDRTYGLDEAAEAVRYLEAGHTRGKIVFTI